MHKNAMYSSWDINIFSEINLTDVKSILPAAVFYVKTSI